jgi:hypothetical protein
MKQPSAARNFALVLLVCVLALTALVVAARLRML